jgi:hypothetical protein
MVYVVCAPGTAVSVPSVLVILRSAAAVRFVISVALSLPGFGSLVAELTVAMFDSIPIASIAIEHSAV